MKRRTRVVRIFPNEKSCLRLVGGIICMEYSEYWQSGRRYLSIGDNKVDEILNIKLEFCIKTGRWERKFLYDIYRDCFIFCVNTSFH
ncbi:MAG: transposase [Candidatus Marinimicrobia bacterium]|nr:transposase [Candidatus Neomarinimicrobiota bacterium]